MALVTRCPNCSTAFRVTPEYLQMQGGNVRCGHCSQVFNSFTALATVQDPKTDGYSKAPDVDTQQEDKLGVLATELSPEEESALEASDVPNVTQGSYTFDAALSPKSSHIWGLGTIFLLVVLMGQIVYLYRTELSVIVPSSKPYLEQYCEFLNCTISLPKQAELLSIVSSDMQTGTGQNSGVITLTATVHNQARFQQAFPSLELALIDTKNQVLASRIFSPIEFLEENAALSGAIAPGDEISVTLYIDSGNLNASGYRLFLLYP